MSVVQIPNVTEYKANHYWYATIKLAVFLADSPLNNSKFYEIEMSLFQETSDLNILQCIT